MKFEVGKYYRHTSGEEMAIVGMVNTTMYGTTLVAESSLQGDLKPVGMGEDHAVNWVEIPQSDWFKNFTDGNDQPITETKEPGIHVVAIGYVGGQSCYINMTREEAIQRYRQANDYTITTDNKWMPTVGPEILALSDNDWLTHYGYRCTEFNVKNTFEVYDIWEGY